MSIYSQVERDFVHRYYFEALYNRLTPPNFGFRCIVQQRLHEMDLTGAVLQRQPTSYKHICLPAEISQHIKPEILKEKYVNGLLDPGRLNLKILQEFKQTLGSSTYTGQYLQTPTPDEGGIFKKDWFEIISPESITRDPSNNPIHFFLDTAYTDKTSNDPTGICTCFAKDNQLYILDVCEVWMEFPQLLEFLKKHILKFHYHHQNSRIYVEPKASGKSVVQQLKSSTMLNVVELESPKDSKVTRANAITPICESKRVKLVRGNYIQQFTDQLISFPNSQRDDMTDAFVYAVNKLLPINTSPDFGFFSL
jgi:predicted phage terminase large subunit-like protein